MSNPIIEKVNLTRTDNTGYQVTVEYHGGGSHAEGFETFAGAAHYVLELERDMMEPKQAEDLIFDATQQEVANKVDGDE